MDLSNATAVVTGAASGIGRALALQCADADMAVVAVDSNEEGLSSLSQELALRDVRCWTEKVDVCDTEQVEMLARRCFESYGGAQLLFNNAGILDSSNCWECPPKRWRQMLEVNVMGVVNGIHCFIPRMIEQNCESHVVNTASIGALFAAPTMGAYTASKMAVRGITETLHYELQMMNAKIGVSLLCPGPIATSMSAYHANKNSSDVKIDHSVLLDKPGFKSPQVCAELVIEAVRNKQYWIFTHPEFKCDYLRNAQALVDEDIPSFFPLGFES